MDALRELLVRQHGVVNRRQVTEAGLTPGDLRTMLRSRDLVRVHKGVFLDHVGPPDWLQRAWAAVLAVEPAALWGPSALRAVQGPGLRAERDPVHVAVDGTRPTSAPSRVVVHRVPQLQDRLSHDAEPPRVRLEEAVLDVAATAVDDHDAVTALARAVRSRLTTPVVLQAALAGREGLPRRRLLSEVLDDAVTGSCAGLEAAYLRDVERAHGLPASQVTGSARGPAFLEVRYQGRPLVELDGCLGRSSAGEPERAGMPDPGVIGDEPTVVRLGWGQVAGHPCDAAIRVDRLLRVLAITSAATPCPACRWRGIWAA